MRRDRWLQHLHNRAEEHQQAIDDSIIRISSVNRSIRRNPTLVSHRTDADEASMTDGEDTSTSRPEESRASETAAGVRIPSWHASSMNRIRNKLHQRLDNLERALALRHIVAEEKSALTNALMEERSTQTNALTKPSSLPQEAAPISLQPDEVYFDEADTEEERPPLLSRTFADHSFDVMSDINLKGRAEEHRKARAIVRNRPAGGADMKSMLVAPPPPPPHVFGEFQPGTFFSHKREEEPSQPKRSGSSHFVAAQLLWNWQARSAVLERLSQQLEASGRRSTR